MIRINLLPFRLARKKENIRRQVSVFLLSILLIGAALFGGTQYIDAKILKIKGEIKGVDAEITLYKEKAQRVTQIKKQLKLLNDKLKIVASLKTRKNEQQILLEEVAERIVKTRMWVESLKADANSVTITGVAFDNPTIADFMRNLEKSALFSSVDLKRSRLRTFEGNLHLKEFELQCRKNGSASKIPPKKGKK